jgi:SAM-dependent methyltransferase
MDENVSRPDGSGLLFIFSNPMKCRVCGSDKLQDILSLGDQYLSDFIDPTEPKPAQSPLNLVLCKQCTLLQMRETTPQALLYTPRYGYRSGINQTMRDHLREICVAVSKRVPVKANDIVVDIGANDGTLLKNYKNVIRVGFEPITKLADECKNWSEIVINDYFSLEAWEKNELLKGKKAKVITAISMFYDLPDPNKFVSDIVNILDKDGLLVIQQNYLVTMLKNLSFDNICHEHLEFYSITSLEKLLNAHGLEIEEAEVNDLNGGSFRVYVKHMETLKKLRLLEKKMKLDNQWTYITFAMQVKHAAHELKVFIEQKVKEGKRVYVYGASTRGNTLIQYAGLTKELITAAVERNPEKVGKLYSGMEIPIISEEQARSEKPDYFLVLPYFFRNEIVEREKEYVEGGGHLIFPLPKLEIV